jgi:peptide subunit release factor 1 (eRF1)/intein/homing endonuclease
MTQITDKQRKDMEDIVNLLGSIRGRHTELVTVLIPAETNIYTVLRQLEAEASTADNIKSKQTRTAVIDSIEMIIRELKNYRQTPKNGLALYAGNISETEGKQDIKLWAFEPPKPLRVRIYRCDQVFIVEPLQEMLDVEEVYGLLVMDRKEATFGVLEGKQIKMLRHLISHVPGKYKAGGQCLSPDTLIMKDDGEIIQMKDSHNPLLIVSENFNTEKTEQTPLITKWENNKELYKIITCYPRFEIKSSKDHLFFVRTDRGVEEKPLSEIREGDYLLMPEKINLDLKKQKLLFTPSIKRESQIKQIKIKEEMDENLAKIAGYYLGDGNWEIDRITFSEQRKEVAEYYIRLIRSYFNIGPSLRFREEKNYYQIRVGSRIVSQLFKYLFAEENKTLNQSIPSIILRSPDSVLASFISGLFDAEGYVSSSRIALGINNYILTKQLQFSLLRLGIISSLLEYDNRRNPYSEGTRYTIEIADIESIKRFNESVGFSSKEKQEKVRNLIKNRSSKNKVRQIAVNGKEVARIIRNSGLTTTQFMCPDFFVNKKQMSKEVFKKNILNKIDNPELKRRLEMFYLSNLIAVKIKSIKSTGIEKTIDIETKSHNFIANGLIVHNSAQRFERIREGMAKEFFKEVADNMKEIFFDMPKLKGILIGGPIPTKEDFLKEGELVTKLKNMVIALKDIGYTDEHGLELLVEASKEDIAQQEMVKEKEVLTRFFETLGKNREKAAYGYDKVKVALERGAVDTLLISKEFDKEKATELEKLAEAAGTGMIIISVDNQDGEQFNNLTKGVGAFLRYQFE